MIKIGIDTGGTFTDFVLQTGAEIKTYKYPSTPDDPARAILKGLAHIFQRPEQMEIIHGTTVGTNAFLERKGAKTLLITTHGFEDVLFIGRQNRSQLYDLNVGKPREIIPRSRCVGVKERLRWDGSIQKPLGATVGRRLRRICLREQIESVAVCFLHSYANPDHEKKIKEQLTKLGLPITLSSDILPEFREYERFSTTVINAYLAPVISSYINRLSAELDKIPLFIQQSNGGILPSKGIAERAVLTVLSGPAGGVHGAFHLARELGLDKIITFDMGGTSTDVSLCDGQPTLTKDYRLDEFPIRTQVMDIHTVGAGGGSIAWTDAGGLLRVGPESAGADPGPICYGKGKDITVTDANLFLGRIPDCLLGGAMPLQKNRVAEEINRLAQQLKMDAEALALGIIRIVNANMVKAVRTVSVERGYDPKEFSLFAFGGAAGLHCCELALELGMRKIIVPARAGILSAQGMVLADPSLDYTQALFLTGNSLIPSNLNESFQHLEKKAAIEANELCKTGAMKIERFLDLRYKGQSHELTVPYEKNFQELFHNAHEHAFGYFLSEMPLELVSIRLKACMERPKTPLPRCNKKTFVTPVAERRATVCFKNDGRIDIPVFKRPRLLYGHSLSGPAIIEDDYTTVLLPPHFQLHVDPLLNLIIHLERRQAR